MVIDDVFAVIAEETRRDILDSLRAGDKAVGQLVDELGASQPTISKHLRVLREASLVTMRAEGQKRFYSLNTVPLQRISGWLNAFDGGPSSGRGPEAVMAESVVLEAAAADSAVLTGPAVPAGALAAAALADAPSLGAGVPGSTLSPASAGPVDAAPLNAVVAVAAPAAVVPAEGEGAALGSRPQQLGRSVGRAANKAADLLTNLPKFGRRKE